MGSAHCGNLARLAGLLALAAALGCSSGGAMPASGDDGPAAGAGGLDAGNSDPFGNASDAGSADTMLTLIDDGGAAVLSDGAIVYLALWDRPCPPDNTTSYEGFGQSFFQSYCLHCHSGQSIGQARNGAPVGLNFDTLQDVRAAAERIWLSAADGNQLMPLSGPRPTAAERKALGDWLACGAPSLSD